MEARLYLFTLKIMKMDLIQLLENRLRLAREIKANNNGFCTYREASILLGVDEATIRMYTYRGTIEKVKIDKKTYVHIDQLAKIQANKTEKKVKQLQDQLKALGE